ncbi:hypothetical protein Tco_0190370 [Tanacetum coccineum]
MITTNSRIEDKKPSELILPPMNILETFPCVKDVDYITRDLAVSSVSAQKQIIGPQESILRDELAFVHFRISTLETTLEDIQVHQNLLQSENFNHQATILVVCYFILESYYEIRSISINSFRVSYVKLPMK